MAKSSDKAQNSLNEVTLHDGKRPSPLHELIKDAYKSILNMHSRVEVIAGYPTGFIDLDHVTNGLKPGELIVMPSQKVKPDLTI